MGIAARVELMIRQIVGLVLGLPRESLWLHSAYGAGCKRQLLEQVERPRQVAGVETQLRQGQEVGGDKAVVLAACIQRRTPPVGGSPPSRACKQAWAASDDQG